MVLAYVLVKANTGEVDRLKTSISELPDVDRVSIVAGDVDFIVKLTVPSPGDLKALAAESIQGLDGVESTRTYVAME